MDAPLLRTKLYFPPLRPELVSRPRLLQRLEEGFAHKLILLSAPAGFGKTTLLVEWTHKLRQGIAVPLRAGESTSTRPPDSASPQGPVTASWLSLDEGDNDPSRFWAYVGAALQVALPDLGETVLVGPRIPPVFSADLLLTDLINTILASPVPHVLILDDYHVIENMVIHETMGFLLDHMPPHLHLVIATRSDPPLPLSRLRGRGELLELRAADLRFTSVEATAFLNETMGLNLSPEEITRLDGQTEGWIVGLQLAALAMQGTLSPQKEQRNQVSSVLTTLSGSHRYILDYLMDEVLQQQLPGIQSFLLYTSILDRLSGPLCEAVCCVEISSGLDNGQQTLEFLERSNLFLVPLDSERRWYRYHHLFADLLRSRLSQAKPDLLPVLHRQASLWYEEHDLIAEAVHHALAEDDFERVAHLVERNAVAMLDYGELAPLVRWLTSLPDEIVCSHPWLCIARAWVLVYTGQLEAAEQLSLDTEGQLGVLPESERTRIAGHIDTMRSYAAWLQGKQTLAINLARKALACLPEEDGVARSLAANTLGAGFSQSGEFSRAEQAFNQAIAISQAAGETHVTLFAISGLAYQYIVQGQPHRALSICQEALRLADEHSRKGGRRLAALGLIYAMMSKVLGDWNQLEAAMRCAREGFVLGKPWGQIDTLTVNYIYLADALRYAGDTAGALAAVREIQEAAGGVSPWFDAIMASTEARIRLAEGNIAAAVRWAQENRLKADNPVSFFNWPTYLLLARVLVAQAGKESRPQESRRLLGEATSLLERLLEVAQQTQSASYEIHARSLLALALQAQGRRDQALAALEQALVQAEPRGYVRIFADGGMPMVELLHRAAGRGAATEYAAQLLAALEEKPPGHPTVSPAPLPPSQEALIEPLTTRELEVLNLLSTGLSNKEIAETLVISIGTVKNHLKNIYGKLEVHSRTAAIARAQELELL